MEYVFSEMGFGYWTSCFDVILEKNGILSFEKHTQQYLSNREHIAKFDFIIISWLPEVFWQKDYFFNIMQFNGPVFLEGPLPKKIANALGIDELSWNGTEDKGQLRVVGPDVDVDFCPSGSENSEYTRISISPKRVSCKPTPLSRTDLPFKKSGNIRCLLNEIALSYLIALRNRFETHNQLFPNPYLDALGWLAWCLLIDKATGLSEKKTLITHLSSALTEGSLSKSDYEKKTPLSIDAIRTIVRHLAANWLAPEITQSESAWENFNARRTNEANHTMLDAAWTVAGLAIRLTHGVGPQDLTLKSSCHQVADELLSRLCRIKANIPAPLLWALGFSARRLKYSYPDIGNLISTRLYQILDADFFRGNDSLYSFEGRPLWEILLLGSLVNDENPQGAAFILNESIESCFDFSKGFFHDAIVENRKFKVLTGYQSSPWVALGLAELIDKIHIRTGYQSSKRYSPNQISAWKAKPLTYGRYRLSYPPCNRPRVHAFWESEGKSYPAIIQSGNIIASTFQIFSQIVHHHTQQPMEEAFLDCPTAIHTSELEHYWIKLIRNIAREANIPLLCVGAWPYGKKFCLTIRHDVDRIPSPEQFYRLQNYENRAGLGTSWYWIPGRMKQKYMVEIEKAGHEIGLHAMRLDQKKNERVSIETHIADNKRVYGESWHGGGGGDFWIGHPSVESAINAGLKYTELMPTVYDFPYSGFPVLEKNGHLKCEKIIGITHTSCLDDGTRKGPSIYKLDWLISQASKGYYCHLLNHPDINFAKLKSWVKKLDTLGKRVNWSCSKVANWWAATHRRESLKIQKCRNANFCWTFRLTSRQQVEDLEIQVPVPKGKRYVVSFNFSGDDEYKIFDPEEMRLEENLLRFRITLPARQPISIRIRPITQ
mgnify:CR=1 FL=1